MSQFTPYRDRPALDKGQRISWTDLESGMLFEPLAGAPTLRRVRGVPQFIWYGEHRSPSFMVGSEDAADGRPCGGIIGCGDEWYTRHYLDDGRAVYRGESHFTADDEVIERLRDEFTAKIAALVACPPDDAGDDDYQRALHVARQNLAKLEEGR